MPTLGLSTTASSGITSSYERDGLKLYMPYNSANVVKFVGEGSTAFITNDKVTVSDASSLSFTTGGLTVMAWVKMTDATQFPIVGKGIYNSTAEYQFKVEGDDKISWCLDVRLFNLSNDLRFSCLEYCIELFRNLYHQVFHDNVYRTNFHLNKDILECEGMQLLKNIRNLSSQYHFNKLFQKILVDYTNENNIPNSDIFKVNFKSDDSSQKAMYVKIFEESNIDEECKEHTDIR